MVDTLLYYIIFIMLFHIFSIEPAMLNTWDAESAGCFWDSLSHWTDCNFSCLQKLCLIDIKHNYLESSLRYFAESDYLQMEQSSDILWQTDLVS